MARWRLNRYLAQAGLASRRKCEALIAEGRVRVNGVLADTPALVVDAAVDRVECDGRPVHLVTACVTLVLNKPRGVITTLRDPQGRRTVAEFLPEGRRVYPVGRLDADTTGLLLLTDDGELAFRVMHPRHGLARSYLALVEGAVQPRTLARLEEGVDLDDGPARALEARRVATDGRRSIMRLTLGEGRKREVRRMCRKVGHWVVELHRERLGPITLRNLDEGRVRPLEGDELEALRSALGLPGGQAPIEPR